MAKVTTAKQEVDKKFMYGNFQKGEDRRARFAERVAHKAADMALEDDEMNITTTKTGISTPGAVGMTAIAAGALLGYGYLNKPQPAAPPPVPPAATSLVDSDYEVRHWTRDGRLIDVQPLPAELRQKFYQQSKEGAK